MSDALVVWLILSISRVQSQPVRSISAAQAGDKDTKLKPEQKAFKTRNADRKVPIHPVLVAEGFLKFVVPIT